MKYISVKDGVYGFWLGVYFDGTEKEAVELFNEYEHEIKGWKGFHERIDNGGVTNRIWLRDSNDIPTLCHELMHFIIKNLEDVGVRIESGYEEPVCYLYEFYIREILKKINKSKK